MRCRSLAFQVMRPCWLTVIKTALLLAQERAFRFFLSAVSRSTNDLFTLLRDTVGSRFNEPLYNEVFIIIYIILFATQ